MEYQDGKSVEYGDIINIVTKDNNFITVEEDGTTITLKGYINNGLKQKILVCGNKKLNNKFYLTFKYSRGFFKYDDNIFESGVPWTEKTIFSIELLKKAIGLDDILILKNNDKEN
jgi:hypothetical protein